MWNNFFIVGIGFTTKGILAATIEYAPQQIVLSLWCLCGITAFFAGAVCMGLNTIINILKGKSHNSSDPNIQNNPSVKTNVDYSNRTIKITRNTTTMDPWICPLCNQKNPVFNKFCQNCGAIEERKNEYMEENAVK